MKEKIKNKLSCYPVLCEYLKYFYHYERNYWRPLPGDINVILGRYFSLEEAKKGVIQIGSNDGVSGDPIFSYIKKLDIPAVLVEPVPKLFSKLKENYAGDENVTCVNAAIAENSENMPFYIVDNSKEQFPKYFDQLGSFDRSIIERQKRDFPDINKYIISIDVKCISFDELVSFANIESCPFLHIDAEGYDLDILEVVDLNNFGYRVVLFEHVHLNSCRYKKFIFRLKKYGYKIRTCVTDTIALRA